MSKQFWLDFLKPMMVGAGILALLTVIVFATGALFHWIGVKVVAIACVVFMAWCIGKCWLEESE
jgi:hypothetical protein